MRQYVFAAVAGLIAGVAGCLLAEWRRKRAEAWLLASEAKKSSLSPAAAEFRPAVEKPRYLVVVDFECTCVDDKTWRPAYLFLDRAPARRILLGGTATNESSTSVERRPSERPYSTRPRHTQKN